MNTKDNVIGINSPAENSFNDPLTALARQGAQRMLATAMEQEVLEFLEKYKDERTPEERQRFIRNGYLPERSIQTGIGDISIEQPRVRDRAAGKDDIQFSSGIIPPYLRRSKSIDELLPLLYLRGISTGDFQMTLTPILGENAKNVSPNVISRLKASWEDEYQTWQKRDLSSSRYVYFWADGIYLQARMEDGRDCLLIIIGVTDKGQKEVIAIEDGYRESKDSWQALVRDLKSRGLTKGPKVATGDGALGFWAALREEFPQTRHQRCWVHKTVNVLDKLPKSQHGEAKQMLHEIWMAATKDDACKAFDTFVNKYGLKYPKAAECLKKDREELLTFYDFPAEHWKSMRTSNPIESTFATVRHRTKRSKGCFSRKTILTMVFKLCQSAQVRWIRLYGFSRLAEVIRGVKFVDGVADKTQLANDQSVAA
ncbi:MAG: IS256 family transposase [Gammaproteobacteria bacterium]|nr:IS256 family transposase [Gammaproteobacteria bacterium]